jgi:hypothetical protein
MKRPLDTMVLSDVKNLKQTVESELIPAFEVTGKGRFKVSTCVTDSGEAAEWMEGTFKLFGGGPDMIGGADEVKRMWEEVPVCLVKKELGEEGVLREIYEAAVWGYTMGEIMEGKGAVREKEFEEHRKRIPVFLQMNEEEEKKEVDAAESSDGAAASIGSIKKSVFNLAREAWRESVVVAETSASIKSKCNELVRRFQDPQADQPTIEEVEDTIKSYNEHSVRVDVGEVSNWAGWGAKHRRILFNSPLTRPRSRFAEGGEDQEGVRVGEGLRPPGRGCQRTARRVSGQGRTERN